MEFAQFASTYSKPGEIPRRREMRLPAALDVRVLGMDATHLQRSIPG